MAKIREVTLTDKGAELMEMLMSRPRTQFVRWDEEYKVLVDEQGIMLSKADVEYLMWRAYHHLNDHSPLEREAIGRRTVERHGPSTAAQFNPDYFREDKNGSDSTDETD